MQSGFIRGDSTVNQLIDFVHTIYQNGDKGQITRAIYLDFIKAFDRVWLRGLLHKLEMKGICGSLLSWFQSYVSDREIITVINGSLSLNQLKLYHKYITQPHIKRNTFSSIINKKYNLSSTVGGCEDVFEEIFGDVLLSRFYPSLFRNQTGMKHCRGILLYGPAGMGKTLIARTICQLLGTQPKIVNGPKVFSSLLGESEAKIRELLLMLNWMKKILKIVVYMSLFLMRSMPYVNDDRQMPAQHVTLYKTMLPVSY
ncbi:unnamed protein product [Didymodactylos carnosus]|uniref:Vesicle-fusing ATPase n=1 Tax=Didymodactylos carnosus TaxID=1234261 RepID=A0A814HJX8_9BILA|nr:unnamed protein product [Didymodactylos carnosus]CAF3781698.1 unnamed protein product [Didymodactylos carnosus]